MTIILFLYLQLLLINTTRLYLNQKTMKKTKKFVAGLLVMAATMGMSSCAMLGTQAGMGAIYQDVTVGEHVTSNALGSKVGTAKATNILGLVAIGDASIETAAKSAGIKRISHVDCKKSSILGIFGTYTVVVYGD